MTIIPTTTARSRRAVAAVFVGVFFATAACGDQTEATGVDTAVPGAPAVVRQAPMITSADAAERRGRVQEQSPTSADAAERRGQQDQRVAPAGKRVTD